MPNQTQTIPNRTFGVELEVKGLRPDQAEALLNAGGVAARYEGYTHRVTSHWKIVTDGSLIGIGCEVVSPVLRGEDGIEQVRKVCRVLARGGARVDRQCGLHVHVGVENLSATEIATIVWRYANFERTIDTFMPASRRGGNNTYCRSLSGYASRFNDINRLRNVRSVTSLVPERHVKLNVQSYSRHRTIEFRHHSGTTNGDKVENWIRFALHFVEASCRVAATLPSPSPRGAVDSLSRSGRGIRRPRRNSVERKLDLVILALREAGRLGVMQHDIASIGGWGVTSVPPYITRLRQERGCNIRRSRRTGRYVLFNDGRLSTETPFRGENASAEPRRAARQVTQAATLSDAVRDDSVFNGIPHEVVSFYEERRHELGTNA